MPQIIPIKDLKNTSEISDMCHKTEEPIYVTKNGYGRLVVMDIEYYERTMQKMCEAKTILEGLEDVKAGRTLDGEKAISKIRSKYGV